MQGSTLFEHEQIVYFLQEMLSMIISITFVYSVVLYTVECIKAALRKTTCSILFKIHISLIS